MASRLLRSTSTEKAARRSRSGQLAEDLGEVRGMLFLEEIGQVCRRTDPEQALDRVEDEIDFALRRHTNSLL